MEKGCFKVLMVASQPARQRSARRNQRCFCCALVAMIGLYANLAQDSLYPVSNGPGAGLQYSGANNYVMHFNKGEMPPVNGFWSITMYDAQYFFVDNPLNRYNVGLRSQFKTNADGSVDLYIQHASPGSNQGLADSRPISSSRMS